MFDDLPVELLPGIVQNVVKPRSLASFCLVNKTFCKYTQPYLYHTITVFPWHHKEKVMHYDREPSANRNMSDWPRYERSLDFFVRYRLPRN